MKKFLLTFIIFVLNFNLGLAQAKLNVDSIIKKIQFKVELFNIKTKDKLKYLNLKSIDTIGIKYLLVIPDYVWIENSEIINGVEFNDFEFKLITLDKLESISDKENKKKILCIAKGLLIPKRKGRLKIKPKEIVLKLKKPTNRKDFFGLRIYENKLTVIKLKSEKYILNIK